MPAKLKIKRHERSVWPVKLYISGTGLEVLEVHTYIRGCHVYRKVWTPTIGEVLLVKPEPTNEKDPNAVAVFKENVIVGHVPRNISPRLIQFLHYTHVDVDIETSEKY